MVDSVKLVNEDVLRRIHANYAGKLHKGHGIVAASSSIPTKFQTIVTDNSDRRGFHSTAKRFNDNVLNDNPGPASYLGRSDFETNSTSFSKKGLGGFASKSRRVQRISVPSGPGTGKYNLPSLLESRKDYNKSNTGNFHQPIANPVPDSKKEVLPAPNHYEPVSQPKGKVNNVHAGAAFKSRSKREAALEVPGVKHNPAPGQYEINESRILSEKRQYDSSFKSKADRNFMPKNENPGPGTYKPHEAIDPSAKTLYPKKHYLCLSAPAMPLPAPPVAPGPGAYELRDYEGPTKHYMSSSVFVSSTSRWQDNSNENPGPGSYHPTKPSKESFIYNHASKWI